MVSRTFALNKYTVMNLGNHTQGLSPALPYGFDYDAKLHPKVANIKNAAGALLHVWRAQGW